MKTILPTVIVLALLVGASGCLPPGRLIASPIPNVDSRVGLRTQFPELAASH